MAAKKRIFIVLALVAAVVLCAAAAAAIYVNGASFRGWLIDQANRNIAGRFTLDQMQLSLFSGRLRFSNAVLADPEGTPLVAVGQGELVVSWPALLRKEIRVVRLHLEQPQVQLLYDAQDRLSLLALFPSGDQGAVSEPARFPMNIVIDDLRITDGSLVFKRPSRGIDLDVERIGLQAGGDLAAQHGRLSLSVETLRQRADGVARVLGQTRLEAQYDGRIDPSLTLALRLPESRVNVSGDLDWNEGAAVIDATGDLDLALNEIGGLLPEPLALTGRAKSRFTVAGALDDPEASLTLAVNGGSALGIDADHLAADVQLKQRRIDLTHFAGKGPWGEIEAAGQVDLQPLFARHFSEKTGDIDALGHDLTISLRGLRLWRLPMLPLPWLGTWQGRLHLAGSGVPLVAGRGGIEADLKGNGFTLPSGADPVDGAVTLSTDWDKGALSIARCRLVVDTATTVDASGVVDLDRAVLDAQAQVTSSRLASLARFVGLPLPDGRATLAVTAKGALSHPEVRAVLQGDALQMPDVILGSVSAEVHLDGDMQLRLKRLELANQGSRLSAEGRLALGQSDPALALDLRFDHLDPSHFVALPELSAQLSGRLTAGGSLAGPVAELRLDPGRISWKGFTSGIEAAAAWQQDRLTLSRLVLARGRSSLALGGEASWQDAPSGDPRVKLDLRGQKLQLADFDERLKGLVSVTAAVEGLLSGLKGRFDLRGDDLDFAVQKIKSLRCDGRLEERSVILDRLAVGWTADQKITGRGRYDLDGKIAFDLSSRSLALSNFDLLRQRKLDGVLDLSVHAEGALDQPVAAADLTIRRLRLDGRPLDDVQLRAQLQQGRLEARGQVVFPLTAALALESGDFNVDADLRRTDLSPYLKLAGLTEWRGSLSGKAVIAGNRHEPARAQVTVDLADVRLAFAKAEVLKIERLAFTLQNGVVDLPATRLRLMQAGDLTLSARGALEKDLEVTADGQIPVSVLEPFAEMVAPAQGQVLVNAKARGPLQQLDWRVDLTLDRIGLGLPEVSQRIERLSGRLSITPAQIDVSGISAQIDDGRFMAEGRLALVNLSPHAGTIHLKLQNVPVELPGTLDLIVGSDLTLRGQEGRALLEGQVTLLEGSYYKNVRLDLLGGLTRLTQPRRAAPVAAGPPPAWLERIGLNVTVTSRAPLIVDNNLAQLDIVPDLRIGGTAARPLATGRAAITEGRVLFRGRTFTVNRGVVDFINPYKIEPSFDIEATATIRQWEVTLAVSGTPDQLVVKLSSDPSESENDILSLILLGQTSAELSSGEGGATTQQMLAGLIATAWGEELKKSARVDILEVETGAESVEDSADRIQVTVGKKLSSRMTLKYEVESNNGEMIQRAVSEYRLMEHLLASGFQDNKGRYGGELLFRLEFR